MRFKTDENLPAQIAELLRQSGHDAMSIPEQKMEGQSDQQVATVCRAEQRAILTLDLDFSDIRQYAPDDYYGIIILRPASHSVPSLLRLTHRVLRLLNDESPLGKLWIVDEHRVRIR